METKLLSVNQAFEQFLDTFKDDGSSQPIDPFVANLYLPHPTKAEKNFLPIDLVRNQLDTDLELPQSPTKIN